MLSFCLLARAKAQVYLAHRVTGQARLCVAMRHWASGKASSPQCLLLPGPVLCLRQLHGQRRSPVHHSPAGKVLALTAWGRQCFLVRSRVWAVIRTAATEATCCCQVGNSTRASATSSWSQQPSGRSPLCPPCSRTRQAHPHFSPYVLPGKGGQQHLPPGGPGEAPSRDWGVGAAL